MTKIYSIFILILVLVSSAGRWAHSFETFTHSAISDRAVSISKLDELLKSQLGLESGILTNLINGQTRTVKEWVQEGSVREDDGFRFFNHFHNPLRGWSQAGLSLVGGESSVLWGQNPGQGYAWKNARDAYFDALTSTDRNQRETSYSQMFQTLGQLIHLTQDAAVPAHTRNDPHPPWNKDGLEPLDDGARANLGDSFVEVEKVYRDSDPEWSGSSRGASFIHGIHGARIVAIIMILRTDPSLQRMG